MQIAIVAVVFAAFAVAADVNVFNVRDFGARGHGKDVIVKDNVGTCMGR
jgi:hypothetical protein